MNVLELKKDETYSIKGGMTVELVEGEALVVGKRVKKGGKVEVPVGKKIPLTAVMDTKLKLQDTGSGEYNKEEDRAIPYQWDKVVDILADGKIKTILVLGEVDTGKTFFSTFVSNNLVERGLTVGVLDSDVGQSDIGPPGTLGLALLKEASVFLTEVVPTEIYFVGSHSPGLHFLPYIVGTKRLVSHSLAKADKIIINTPGWVLGDGGRAIRKAEIDLLEPDMVILMQREAEVEHLVKTYDPAKVLRVTVSKKASHTSPGDRKFLRERASKKYFNNSVRFEVATDAVTYDRGFIFSGKPVPPEEEDVVYVEKLPGYEGTIVVVRKNTPAQSLAAINKKYNMVRLVEEGEEKGVIVGLLDGAGTCTALGIIERIDYKNRKISFFAPVKDISALKTIQFGSLKATPMGEEAGFVTPGYF